jgi:endoglucanase
MICHMKASYASPGWYDAGDFDLEKPSQLSVIQNLALAYREFNLK